MDTKMPEEKHAANPSTINIRPDVDVILSLNKDYYKGIMEGVFQKLGVKVKGEAKGQENKAAMEVLGLFKNRKLGAKTRYYKNERYSKALVEIDEHAAYKSKCTQTYMYHSLAIATKHAPLCIYNIKLSHVY